MQIDLTELKNQLEPNDIIGIIKTIIPDLRYEEFNNYLILPTICHNLNQEDASMKLYYYYNTNLFFCYTQCNSSFDIYELIKKILVLRDLPSDFTEVFNIITKNVDKDFNFVQEDYKYHSFLDKYEKKNQTVNFEIYNKDLINFFEDYYYKGWIDEGISIESMKKYNIKFVSNYSEFMDENSYFFPENNVSLFLNVLKNNNIDFNFRKSRDNKNPDLIFKIKDQFYILEHKLATGGGGSQNMELNEIIEFIG